MNGTRTLGHISAETVPPGYVYFITDGEAVKIGYSRSPRDRLNALQTAHHKGLWIIGHAPGGMWDEDRLHKRFAETRLSGEWFESTPELMAFIPEFCCARTKTEAVRRELNAWASDKGVRLNRLIGMLDKMLRSLAQDHEQPGLRRSLVIWIKDLGVAAAALRRA